MSIALGSSGLRQQFPLLVLVLALIASVFTSAAAQGESNKERPRRVLPTETEPQDIIKIETDLVPVEVTVLDAKGRLVRNLKKADFKIYEDGAERPIASFNVEKIEGAPRPVAIVFALDLSGSMTPEEVARVSDAMREFSKRLAEHPAVFAVMDSFHQAALLQSADESCDGRGVHAKLLDALARRQ